MTDTRRIENVQIHAAERRRNSANGNPGWKLHTSQGTYALDAEHALRVLRKNR